MSQAVITAGAFDSQNLAFWDAVRGEYRAYWRIFTAGFTDERGWKPGGYRAIRTATSKDFIHWENQADLRYVDSPAEHLYTNAISPTSARRTCSSASPRGSSPRPSRSSRSS